MQRDFRKLTKQEVEQADADFAEQELEPNGVVMETPVSAVEASPVNSSVEAGTKSVPEDVAILTSPTPERLGQIAANFSSSRGILSQQEVAELNFLPAHQIFELLASDPTNISAAIYNLRYFPSAEMVIKLSELLKDKKYQTDRATILWILEQFTIHPECSQQAIKILKELEDPRAIYEYDKGTIEAATQEQAKKIMAMAPPIVEEQFLLAKIKDGSVFFLTDNQGEVVNFAIAIKYPKQYLLHLHYIYTNPGKRGQGYGEDMIKYLLKEHAVLTCELFKGHMLSEQVLKKLKFSRVEGMGDKWVYGHATHKS